MQTIKLKFDIISYIAELTDRKLIQGLCQWGISKNKTKTPTSSIDFISPKRKGALTDGYGIWSNDGVSSEQNYRENIWETDAVFYKIELLTFNKKDFEFIQGINIHSMSK